MANVFTEQLTNTASGWLSQIPEVMSSPIGDYLYFVLAFIIIFVVLPIVIWIIVWGKKQMWVKKKGRYRRRP